MTYGIKKILLRAAMGIMTGGARFGPGLDTLMGGDKPFVVLFVALCAKFTGCDRGQSSIVGTVCIVASSAILCSGRMQSTIPPIFSHLAMTLEAKRRQAFAQIAAMG
jgi:hypothetical protein